MFGIKIGEGKGNANRNVRRSKVFLGVCFRTCSFMQLICFARLRCLLLVDLLCFILLVLLHFFCFWATDLLGSFICQVDPVTLDKLSGKNDVDFVIELLRCLWPTMCLALILDRPMGMIVKNLVGKPIFPSWISKGTHAQKLYRKIVGFTLNFLCGVHRVDKRVD